MKLVKPRMRERAEHYMIRQMQSDNKPGHLLVIGLICVISLISLSGGAVFVSHRLKRDSQI